MKQNLIYSGDIVFSNEGAEPVNLADMKTYIRVSPDITDDDNLITSLIKAARAKIEMFCGVSLITRTIQCRLLNQLGDIELPFGPVDEITEITDVTGTALDDDTWTLDGVSFKTLNSPSNTEVTVTYTVTAPISSDEWKTYIKGQVAFMYEHRGDENEIGLSPLIRFELKSKRRF
jgi:uncharacterized phiE125 gp8 family phage protein